MGRNRNAKRVVFFDPYLQVLGGGEKVLLTIVEEVARPNTHDVLMLSPVRPDPSDWQRLHVQVNLDRVRWRRASERSATLQTLGADLFVALTNGFPPISVAKHSAAIVQFPYTRIDDTSGRLPRLHKVDRRLRLRSHHSIVCYSDFVAAQIRERLRIQDPVVVAPPVDLPEEAPTSGKERKVIAVGRFFPPLNLNNKNHDVMIEAWRQVEAAPEADGWELHLVGGLLPDHMSQEHFADLQDRARGHRIIFHPNATREVLRDLYWRSSLFWHAAGYGETEPGRWEHFGITTVEAMAHGCVPVVAGCGGQLEVVDDGANGMTWGTVDELIKITQRLMTNPAKRQELASRARAHSRMFGRDIFTQRIRETVLVPSGIV